MAQVSLVSNRGTSQIKDNSMKDAHVGVPGRSESELQRE